MEPYSIMYCRLWPSLAFFILASPWLPILSVHQPTTDAPSCRLASSAFFPVTFTCLQRHCPLSVLHNRAGVKGAAHSFIAKRKA